eukprot:5003992-Karenia_brevis.AAC.1
MFACDEVVRLGGDLDGFRASICTSLAEPSAACAHLDKICWELSHPDTLRVSKKIKIGWLLV